MRLLDTSTYRLHEFMEGSIPPYAILSHTWDPGEVQFKDLEDLNIAQTRKAWPKISKSCHRAYAQGHRWVWIDTCCIDKSSSAELSEAINSMWKWYKYAEVCYAYLADVKPIWPHSRPVSPLSRSEDEEEKRALLAPSRWFTRGWTLQELIAPTKVEFLSSDWSKIGDKVSLQGVLQAITGIDVKYLLGGDLSEACVAQKMCWASKRQTTRSEDVAYCLLGIFDINMPLLYGEGQKAFRRLQEEIIRATGDQSIFAWKMPASTASKGNSMSVLASHPMAFAESNHIRLYTGVNSVPSTLTNQGIRIPLHFDHDKDHEKLLLLCRRADDKRRAVGIRVRIVGAVNEVNHGHNIITNTFDQVERLYPDRFCAGIPDQAYTRIMFVK